MPLFGLILQEVCCSCFAVEMAKLKEAFVIICMGLKNGRHCRSARLWLFDNTNFQALSSTTCQSPRLRMTKAQKKPQSQRWIRQIRRLFQMALITHRKQPLAKKFRSNRRRGRAHWLKLTCQREGYVVYATKKNGSTSALDVISHRKPFFQCRFHKLMW